MKLQFNQKNAQLMSPASFSSMSFVNKGGRFSRVKNMDKSATNLTTNFSQTTYGNFLNTTTNLEMKTKNDVSRNI